MANVVEAMPGFKFGADPELFIIDGNGDFVCAEGMIPGTKVDPYKVKAGAVQVDGMAAEFNIDPAETFEEFDYNIATVVKELGKFLPKDHSLVAVPSAVFSEEVWRKAPRIAKQLGCTPDFNAWTGSVNPSPNGRAIPRMRTAAGHIHIGWKDPREENLGDIDHINNCRDLVRQLDWYLGGWSVSVDKDPVRRSLYGKAGACRFKPYGVEYRVLSNFWVTSRSGRREVWNRTQQAIWDMASNYAPEKAVRLGPRYGMEFNERLVKSINESSIDQDLRSVFPYPLSRVAK